MRISSLMTISEGAGFYRGGVDLMPELSLDEAVGGFPVAVLEAKMELNSDRADMNSALVEAFVGGGYGVNTIIEGAWDTLKTKVKSFFQRIKKWLQSIIEKLKQLIDKIRMTGSQLYNKYYKMVAAKASKLKDMDPFNGYDFTKSGIKLNEKTKLDDVVAKVCPEADYYATAKTKEQYEDAAKKITDKTNEQIGIEVATAIVTGYTPTKSWATELRNKMWGEKVDMKYGKGSFTLENVSSLLKEPMDLASIREGYETMHSDTEKKEKEFSDAIEKADKEYQNAVDNTEAGDKTNMDKNETENARISVMRAVLNLYSSVYSAIGTLKNIHTDFEKARINQAKAMFGRMISFNADKKKNEDFDDGEAIVDFEVDV